MAYAMPALAAYGWKGWVAAVAVVAVQYYARSLAAAILVGVAAMAGLGALEIWFLAR
jgi:branched-subunit amino acid transport protein